ncbi:hypothetical protein [Staphylococcus pseudintermedius]|uniref:hypothetical protein n=1 Tax=Staphylococcus pseudintermedius TaxID=283734 RepID=UPI001F5B527C
MKNLLFWSKNFIPVYFIVAFLAFLLFRFYIKTDNYSVYLLILLCLGMGIASLVYNYKNKKK